MIESVAFWAETSSFIGKALIAVMALLVHHKIEEEGAIDRRVMFEIKLETFVGSVAILLLTIGYILEVTYVI